MLINAARGDTVQVTAGEVYYSTGLFNLGTNDQLPDVPYGFTSLDVANSLTESVWPFFSGNAMGYIELVGEQLYGTHAVYTDRVIIQTDQGGYVQLISNGDFVYIPPPDFKGVDSFSYVLLGSDNTHSAPAVVTLNVGPPADQPPADVLPIETSTVEIPPVDPVPVTPPAPDPVVIIVDPLQVLDDTVSSHSSSLSVNVLANDHGSGALSVLSVEAVLAGGAEATVLGPGDYDVVGGTLHIGSDGTFAFEAAADFVGSQSFAYTATDDAGQTATATAIFERTNDAAAGVDDYFSTDYGKSIHSTLNVLTNDTDADNDALSVTPFALVRTVNGGLVSLNKDGTFIYTPKFGFHGEDTFSYEVSDGIGKSSSAIAYINVEPPKGAILGSDAGETLAGSLADDIVFAGGGKDLVTGSSGNDILLGEGGSDSVSGGDGADILDGGANGDRLSGGKGFDKFVLGQSTATDYDRIMDYASGEKLVVHGAEYGLTAGDALDASYLVRPGSAESGHGRFVYDAGAKSLYWDSGEPGASLQLLTTFAKQVALSASDFEIV